jgi:hypothetical protein
MIIAINFQFLEYVIRKTKTTVGGLKLSGTHELLALPLISACKAIVQILYRNTGSLIETTIKEIVLEVSTEKT